MELVDKMVKLGEMGFSKQEIAALLRTGYRIGELEVVMTGNPNIGLAHDFTINRAKEPNIDENIPSIEEVSIPKINEEKPAEEPKEVETPKIVETKDDSETIERLKTIEDTLKGIQANNIKWSNMPTVTEEKSELEIVQEILGGIKPNGNE